MVWSSDETRIFVKLYLSHSCLWNTSDEDYKNKHKRQIAYQDISKKFQALTNIQMNQYEVRTKIKNLRSTYAQEKQKIQRKSTHKSSLKWFDDFHKCFSGQCPNGFFDKTCEPSDDQQELEMETEDSSQKIWMPETKLDNDHEDTSEQFVSETNDDYILLLKNEPDQDPVEETHEVTPRKSYRSKKSKLRRRVSSSDQDLDHKVVSQSNEDEYDIYGKYIASQLRCMGVARAMRVQLKIQSIVSEARIEALTGKNK